jgi:hypothetical protein
MKKVMLTMAGALMIGIATVNAQDTTRRTDPQRPAQEEQPSPSQDQYRSGELVPLPIDQVPADLKKTLEAPEYKGWENASLYQNKSTKEYVLQMNEGDNRKVYRFDSKGQPMKNGQLIKPEGQ